MHRGLIAVNGVELEYIEDGAGDPIVFTHGGASDLRYWEPQRSFFSTRFRFIAYSRRFHGTGAWPATWEASREAHADDLIALVRRIDAGAVHLVGFSATTALDAAVREPSLVRSLTIFEPNAPSLLTDGPDDQAIVAAWQSATERVRHDSGTDVVAHALLWFELVNNTGPGTFEQQSPDFRRMWLQNFAAKRSPSTGPGLACSALARITAPALALGGEHGMLYSRRILERVAGCIPRCEMEILPGATHFASYQKPALFNTAVLGFVSAH